MSKIVNNEKFIQGVLDLVTLVGSTMGPFGHNVMLTRRDASFVWRDGAQVVRGYIPNDSVEFTAVKRIRDAAESTLNFAGDGTSTTTVLLGSLYLALEETLKREDANGRLYNRKAIVDTICTILTRMEAAVEESVLMVQNEKGEIDLGLLEKVATVAANNNGEIGKVVAGLIAQLGHSGGVKIEFSKTGKIETSVQAGYAFDSGLYSPIFLNPGEKQVTLENPYVVLVNDSLLTWPDLKFILDGYNLNSFTKGEGRALVIVCPDMGGVALATAMARQHHDEKGNPTGFVVPLYIVRNPLNINSEVFFEDMMAVTGARIMSRPGGNLLHTFKWSNDAGTAERIILSVNSTAIAYKPHGNKHRLSVEKLTERLELEKADANIEDQQAFSDRTNRLRGSVGTISIPGNTQGAIIMGKEVVEDSYMACQSAMKYGVLPGCGRALVDALYQIQPQITSPSDTIAFNIVAEAAKAVIGAVVQNAGGSQDLVDMMASEMVGADHGKTFSIDTTFAHYAVSASKEISDIKTKGSTEHSVSFEEMVRECFVDAVDAGVLDSAGGVIGAIRNTKSEIALWGMTKHIVKDA